MPSPSRRPTRSARWLLVLLLAAAAAGLAHWLTLRWSATELPAARARIDTLESEVDSLSERLQSAQSERAQMEQEARITRQANRLLREEESARQAELYRLQGELDFYRRLAGTSGSQTGLAVYHLELSPSASPRVYRFVLTLTQNLRRSAITTGTVRIAIEGTRNNRPVTLPWSRITEDSPPPPTFRFKYFEQVSGYLALPEGFEPVRVVVTLEARGQNKPVTRGFDWQRLIAPDTDLPPAAANPDDAGTRAAGDVDLGGVRLHLENHSHYV